MIRVNKQNNLKAQSFQLKAQVDSEIEIRTETLLGKEYTVVPVIAMVEGVRYGANAEAPELGLASEFGQDLIMWANRPLVLNHPQTEFDGEQVYCSANSPEILEQYCFGMTMNPYLEDSKLKMEAWFDVARIAELGGEFQEIYDAIIAQEMVEVSVGFFSIVEPKKGKFRGQSYSGIWRNIKPDHLAVLSIGTLGACSNTDGCGIPRINQEANMPTVVVNDHSKNPGNVQVTVDKAQGCGCGGHDKSTCSCDHDHSAELNTQEELENHLVDEPDRTEARNLASKMISQAIDGLLVDTDVRKIITKALRSKFPNNDVYLYGFTSDKAIFEYYGYMGGRYQYATFQIGVNVNESGVEFVGEAEEVVLLTKIVPQATISNPTPTSEASSTTVQSKENDMTETVTHTPTNAATTPAAETTTTTTPASTVTQASTQKAEPMTVQAYIANAPEEVREVLESSIKMHSDRKNACIEKIKANKGNKFSDDALKAFKLDVLESMVALMGEEVQPNYSGVAAPTNQQRTEDNSVPAPPRLFAVKSNA